MNTVSLQSILLVDEGNKDLIIERVDMIEKRLRQNAPDLKIFSHRETLMVDFLQFSVDGINWDIGIQIQEFLEELDTPVIFIGSSGSGLTDISSLRKGDFDSYIISILTDPDALQEFLTYFLPTTPIIDYCLTIWSKVIKNVTNQILLEQLVLLIDYSPLKSLILEQQDRIVDAQKNMTKEQADKGVVTEENNQEMDESNDNRPSNPKIEEEEDSVSKETASENKKVEMSKPEHNLGHIKPDLDLNSEHGISPDISDTPNISDEVEKKEEIKLTYANQVDEEKIRKTKMDRKKLTKSKKRSKPSKEPDLDNPLPDEKEDKKGDNQQSLDDFF